MSTTVTYKGQTLTTVENQTKTLNTAGTWVEGDFTLTDVTQGGGGDEIYKLAAGTITDADIDWSKVTNVRPGSFWECKQITSVNNPTIDNFYDNLFRQCDNLTKIEVGVTALNPRYGANVMRDNPKLAEVIIHFLYSQNPNNPIYLGGNYFFTNDPLLTTVTFEVPYAKFAFSGNWMFYNTSALRNIVIKYDKAVAGLDGGFNANSWGGIYNNPTESTIWVPQALISDYQVATNWSNLYAAGVTFAPIEGSIYDD
jgi:hypothetical protein